jgi:hypothetical protein
MSMRDGKIGSQHCVLWKVLRARLECLQPVLLTALTVPLTVSLPLNLSHLSLLQPQPDCDSWPFRTISDFANQFRNRHLTKHYTHIVPSLLCRLPDVYVLPEAPTWVWQTHEVLVIGLRVGSLSKEGEK